MAQLGGSWSGPLSPVPLCMKGAGRAKKSRGPSGDPPALDLSARLFKKQTVGLGEALPPSFSLWKL